MTIRALSRSRSRIGAVEGTAALLAECVKEAEVIAHEDLGSEAIRRLVVQDFLVVIVNDLHGGDLYREGRERWNRIINGI